MKSLNAGKLSRGWQVCLARIAVTARASETKQSVLAVCITCTNVAAVFLTAPSRYSRAT